MSKMVPVHPQFHAQTQERISELKAQLVGVQAEAAAMRDALQHATTHLPEDREVIRAALAPDAGKALLERLERTETECAVWKESESAGRAVEASLLVECDTARVRAEKAELAAIRALGAK